MFKLLKGATVYAPEKLGATDILIWNDRIIKIAPDQKIPEGFEGKVFDLSDNIIITCIVDTQVHISGGGAASPYYENTVAAARAALPPVPAR